MCAAGHLGEVEQDARKLSEDLWEQKHMPRGPALQAAMAFSAVPGEAALPQCRSMAITGNREAWAGTAGREDSLLWPFAWGSLLWSG